MFAGYKYKKDAFRKHVMTRRPWILEVVMYFLKKLYGYWGNLEEIEREERTDDMFGRVVGALAGNPSAKDFFLKYFRDLFRYYYKNWQFDEAIIVYIADYFYTTLKRLRRLKSDFFDESDEGAMDIVKSSELPYLISLPVTPGLIGSRPWLLGDPRFMDIQDEIHERSGRPPKTGTSHKNAIIVGGGVWPTKYSVVPIFRDEDDMSLRRAVADVMDGGRVNEEGWGILKRCFSDLFLDYIRSFEEAAELVDEEQVALFVFDFLYDKYIEYRNTDYNGDFYGYVIDTVSNDDVQHYFKGIVIKRKGIEEKFFNLLFSPRAHGGVRGRETARRVAEKLARLYEYSIERPDSVVIKCLIQYHMPSGLSGGVTNELKRMFNLKHYLREKGENRVTRVWRRNVAPEEVSKGRELAARFPTIDTLGNMNPRHDNIRKLLGQYITLVIFENEDIDDRVYSIDDSLLEKVRETVLNQIMSSPALLPTMDDIRWVLSKMIEFKYIPE